MSAQNPSPPAVRWSRGRAIPSTTRARRTPSSRSTSRALTKRLVATTRADRRGALPAQRRAAGAHPAVDAARRGARRSRGPARPSWPGARTSLDDRAGDAAAAARPVLDRQDEIIDLIVRESGKARKHAFDEPLHVALTARYYARTAHEPPRHPAQARASCPALTRVEVNRVPKGVVGIISPWNYPFTMALCDGLPALLAGNAVVAKPDAQTMLSALLGAAAARGGRLPAGPVAGRRRPRPRDRSGDRSSAPTTSASPARPRPAG